MNPDATDADGMRAAELENQYGEHGRLDGRLRRRRATLQYGHRRRPPLQADGKSSPDPKRVKVLLAQALFGNPDILLLDEPTNDLDAQAVHWLADFLASFPNTVIVVSHDPLLPGYGLHPHRRHRPAPTSHDLYGQLQFLVPVEPAGHATGPEQEQKDGAEARRNAGVHPALLGQTLRSPSRPLAAKRPLEKLNLEEIKPSSRRYPFIAFQPEREPGDQILKVSNLSKKSPDGSALFSGVNFTMNSPDKIALVSMDSAALTAFYEVLAGLTEPDSGSIEWGQTITPPVPAQREQRLLH